MWTFHLWVHPRTFKQATWRTSCKLSHRCCAAKQASFLFQVFDQNSLKANFIKTVHIPFYKRNCYNYIFMLFAIDTLTCMHRAALLCCGMTNSGQVHSLFVHQMLAEAERTCGELQRAASMLEGRLAELDHWSTESLDRHQHLKEKKHSGRSALGPTAQVSKPKFCAPSN